jgi:hypothetical protein
VLEGGIGTAGIYSAAIIRAATGIYPGGQTVGNLLAVTGNYGSVQCSGADGSSGTYSGYSINGEMVMMHSGATGGLYNDSNNQWVLQYTENAGTRLYYQTTSALETQNWTAADDLSSVRVLNEAGVMSDVGFATMDNQTVTGARTISPVDAHKTIRITSGTGAINFTSDGNIKVGAVGWILNVSGSNNTLTATTNVYWADGAGGQTGSRTLADGGWVTWWKQADAQYYITGTGIT